MSEAADPLDRNQIPHLGITVAQGIERRIPGTDERGCIDGIDVIGDRCQCFGGRGCVLCVSTVVGHPGHLPVLTAKELPTTTWVTAETVATVPANTDAITLAPIGDITTNSIDTSGDFVTGNARIPDLRIDTLFYVHITETHPTPVHRNTNLGRAWVGNLAFNDLEFVAWFLHDSRIHCIWHTLRQVLSAVNNFSMITMRETVLLRLLRREVVGPYTDNKAAIIGEHGAGRLNPCSPQQSASTDQ
jgi:hypothetical protein